MRIIAALLSIVLSSLASAAPNRLEIYFVDVEGGAATLIVGPSGESMLVDTANPGQNERDAIRIQEVAKLAGLTQIDVLVTTHYHGDHIGALQPLVQRIPIMRFIDHGDITQAPTALYKTYQEISSKNRTIVKAGDRIPMNKVTIQVVSSAGKVITEPVDKKAKNNPFCEGAITKGPDRDPDNNASVGLRLQYGKFTFLNLGDLGWQEEHLLACPHNLLGKIDVYQTTHHGLDRSGSPQLVKALEPRAVIMNNSARKGAAPLTLETLKATPGRPDLWQGHLSETLPKESQGEEQMMANIAPSGPDDGHWIKLSAEPNGKYTITNSRNSFSKTYRSR